MKRTATYLRFFFSTVLTLSVLTASAQNPRSTKAANALDFGIIVGASNYMGELTKGSLPVLSESHLAGGAMIRYNFRSSLSLRASALFMNISGTDANFAAEDAFRERRNLSFRSRMWEFSGGLEWNILGWQQTRKTYPATPYLFASLAVFRFNPEAQFFYNPSFHHPSLEGQDGKWIELQPLSTEAQETTKNNDTKRYPLTQISIPFGVGYKIMLNDYWTAGIEFGLRKTFTDYLDDISTKYWDDNIVGGAGGFMSRAMKDRSEEAGFQRFEEDVMRGNPQTKDWYMFGGVSITYRILGSKVACFNFQ
jgi:hypothetical protein